MKTTSNYTDKIADVLYSALAADEKEIAPTHDRGDQRIWSVRQYIEGWLQYLLMKALNHDATLQLAFEVNHGRGPIDITILDARKTTLCGIEIKGPHRADENTRRMVLDDIRKQISQPLPGCELSVFALVHGRESEVERWEQQLRAETESAQELIGCQILPPRDVKLNKDRNGEDQGVLRITVVRIPPKR